MVLLTSSRVAAPRGRIGPTWRYAARLWAVVLCFLAVVLVRSAQVGIPLRDPHGAFLAGRLLVTVAVFAALVLVDGLVRAGLPVRARAVLDTIRSRWTPARLALAWAALLAYHLTYFGYHNLKSWDAFNTPQDPMLWHWDRWLCLGHTPAVLLHDVLGQRTAAWVLMAWYETFPTLVVVAFPAAVVLAGRLRDAYAGIAALVWIWILGTATYYAVPSLGPFSYAPADFAGLPHMSIQDTQARYLAEREQLLAHPHAAGAFAQVSAFASLHVGVTAVIVGLAWWHRLRRTTAVLTVFLVGTMVATVYLGWHFAVDDLAGLGIAALAWWLGPRSVGVRRRPPVTSRRAAISGSVAASPSLHRGVPSLPGMRTVIVVPTYNEAATIGVLLDELVGRDPVAGSSAPVDVLVVDDSSPDGTAAIVRSHPAYGGRVRLLTRATKDGLGAAYRAGFRAALADGYDAVVQMDADGSHPAAAVDAMLAGLGTHDLVIGSRYVAGGRTRNWPRRRRALSWAANGYARGVLGLRTRDATSGFRAWRASALLGAGVLETISNGYGFQVENTWRAERAGLRVAEHPITFEERTAGRSKMSVAVAREAAVRVLLWRVEELRGRGGDRTPQRPRPLQDAGTR